MTQPQPGWYPDPADPDRQRYWAGDAWTAETRQLDDLAPAVVERHAAFDPDTSGTATQRTGQMPFYRGPASSPINLQARLKTADGVPLAGWWWRVLAWFLDWLLLTLASFFYAGFTPDYTKGLTAWQNDYLQAFRAGSTAVPLPFDPQYAIAVPMAIGEAVSVGVACVYVIVMLHFTGATLGQLVLGIRVVPEGQGLAPRPLAMSHVIRRVLGWNVLPAGLLVAGILLVGNGFNAFLGMLCILGGSMYSLLAALWAAWDPKRQGWHDKIAGTQLIRLER